MNLFQNSYNTIVFDSARFPAALKSVSTIGVVTSLRGEINTPKPEVTKEPKFFGVILLSQGHGWGNHPQYKFFFHTADL